MSADRSGGLLGAFWEGLGGLLGLCWPQFPWEASWEGLGLKKSGPLIRIAPSQVQKTHCSDARKAPFRIPQFLESMFVKRSVSCVIETAAGRSSEHTCAWTLGISGDLYWSDVGRVATVVVVVAARRSGIGILYSETGPRRRRTLGYIMKTVSGIRRG